MEINSNTFIPFYDLICDKDYFFVLSTISFPDIFLKLYFQLYTLLILDEKTNIINLSPLQSDYYTIVPRENGYENLSYSFNEDKFSFIIFNKGIVTLKEDNTIIYEKKEMMRGIFKKDLNLKKIKNMTFILIHYLLLIYTFVIWINIHFLNMILIKDL